MAKMMILGMKGEDGLWLIDFDAGTATPIDGKREDYLAGAGTDGDASGSNIDVALAFDTKEEAFGGFMYKTPATDFAVAFDTKEEAFGGFMYKTPSQSVPDSRSSNH